MRKVELLAPARDLECGKAAIDYGADAVYIGAPSFGARQAAGNTVEDIAALVRYARPFGVRVYATLNTLLFDDELAQAEAFARQLTEAGVDALIVQDMAFMRMGLQGVELHASTQTCNTDPEHVRFLERCGFSRVILERGLTLEQIKDIRAATDVELECFVHGAICVGFSGRCYMSRSMGPRSGNRGDCSQPCRLSYDLVGESGETLIKSKYLLSVKDLDFSARIGDLLDAGVVSFKIEGRLKDAAYVKNVTLHYSRLLDAELARREDIARASSGRVASGLETDPGRTFSRGGTTWMLGGKRAGAGSHDTPKAAGAYVGTVKKTAKDHFIIDTRETLSPGDGICFIAGGELKGTNINKAEGTAVYPNRMDAIVPGMAVFRNYDRRFAVAVESDRARRTIDVSAAVQVADGGMLVRYTDPDGNAGCASYEGRLDAASNPAAARENMRAQLAKSGGTIFNVTSVGIPEDMQLPFVPVSALNGLRREALDKLLHIREQQRPAKELPAEEPGYPYPAAGAGGELNVTNRLAEQFYRDHGVTDVKPGYDLAASLDGATVMTSAYCLRRELGACLKEGGGKGRLVGELYLHRGRTVYRLEFDCGACLMKIVKTDKTS